MLFRDCHSMGHIGLYSPLVRLPVRSSLGSEQRESQTLLPESHPTRVVVDKVCERMLRWNLGGS